MVLPAGTNQYIWASPRMSRSASPYQSDIPGRPPIWRGPRRSPPRGLNRGVGLLDGMFLTSLCLHRLLLFEPQSAGAGVDDHRVAFAESPFEHLQGQRIEHAALNRPLEWTGAIRGVVALGHQIV